MIVRMSLSASALAFASMSAPLAAQAMSMPGMDMPMPSHKPRETVHSRSDAKNSPATNSKKRKESTARPEQANVGHAEHRGMSTTAPAGPELRARAMPRDRSPMPSATMTMPIPPGPDVSAGQMELPSAEKPMSGMPMGKGGQGMHGAGAYGPYPQQRESSGTAWQPDSSAIMGGPMLMAGEWMLMAHGVVNLVYDRQSGPRGDDKAFASGMLMGMAKHPLGNGTFQLRAMLSPDPAMGPSGYPLLLATGETADGQNPLIDRQHPHDFVMELSASVSQDLGTKTSVFLYGGLPGEPAFGPPAFMHREAILDSPEAPITHHWFDSTHISFGVITAGLVFDRLKVEVSRFNAREPDQHRWNIETGPLDSTALRISWNPVRTLALQGSWGYFKDPEQLEPGVDQKRLSASALWADEIAPGWNAAATLAWGRKIINQHHDDALAAEASLKHAKWTLFGRAESIHNRELLGLDQQSPAFRVGKLSLGAVRDFRVADHLSFGIGGLYSVNFVPDALAPLYGGHNPTGAMGFVRLRLN